MDGPWRLEVWRKSRLVFAGSPPELLAAAEAGRLRHDDEVRVPENGATFRPHEIPFLARHVPSRLEASTRRSLRILYVADAILIPLGVLFLLALWSAYGMDGLRNGLLPLFVFVVLFVAPIPALRARLRQLREARARGFLPAEGAERTTGDARLDALLGRTAVVTRIAIGVIVVVSVAAFLLPEDVLLLRLAKTNEGIAAGEWWRLVTPVLVHGSGLHLAMNMLALADVGGAVENLYGRARMLAIFLVGAAGATIASVRFNEAPSVGASGGLFALVGALLVFGIRHRDALAPPARNRLVRGMLWVVAVNLAIGFTATFIDNAAHVGGLVTGIALGAVLPPAELTRRVLRASPSVRPRSTGSGQASTGSGRTE